MRINRLLAIIGGISCMFILNGCVIKNSPAPGCVKSIGIPVMGGCFGKTAIVDFKVKSAPDCVVIEVNNCNGGVLDIQNTCSETIQLGGLEILPTDSIILDVKETDGTLEPMETSSNFSQFTPEADTSVKIKGIVGNETIELAFTKTKPLCK